MKSTYRYFTLTFRCSESLVVRVVSASGKPLIGQAGSCDVLGSKYRHHKSCPNILFKDTNDVPQTRKIALTK